MYVSNIHQRVAFLSFLLLQETLFLLCQRVRRAGADAMARARTTLPPVLLLLRGAKEITRPEKKGGRLSWVSITSCFC